MKNAILNNLGLKLLALFLAIVTWFYVVGELQKGTIEEREALKKMLPYRMVSKKIPIELNIKGKPQKGYTVLYDKIIIDPSACVIVGPRSLLAKVASVKTEPINISEYAKTFTKDVSIVSPVKEITIKEKFVNVTIPIAKIED